MRALYPLIFGRFSFSLGFGLDTLVRRALKNEWGMKRIAGNEKEGQKSSIDLFDNDLCRG